MSPAKRLSLLHARKEELLVQSEVNRRLLTAECTTLEARVWWIEPATGLVSRAQSFWSAISPWVKGFSSAKAASRPLLSRIASTAEVAQRVVSAWRESVAANDVSEF